MVINDNVLSSVNKLMIVAHPDDETIWGGQHLLSDKWLVVCITYRETDEPRGREFREVLEASNNYGIMLGFPDEFNGRIDKWKVCKSAIEFELRKIIISKKWSELVTHNPDGEYSHFHHILTSKIVTSITTENLFYFGKYYEKGDRVLKSIPTIDESWIDKKKQLMKLYRSQGFSANAFEHMFPYEYFIPHKDWKHYKRPIWSKSLRFILSAVSLFVGKIKWHLSH